MGKGIINRLLGGKKQPRPEAETRDKVALLEATNAKLVRRVDFLRGIIDRLQAALGLVIEIEAKSQDTRGYKTKVNFSFTLTNRLWEEAKAAQGNEIRAAICTMINYKVQKMLQDGQNGWIEEIDLSGIEVGKEQDNKVAGRADRGRAAPPAKSTARKIGPLLPSSKYPGRLSRLK